MRLCVVSLKPCWQDDRGRWLSAGGFPPQMAALGERFGQLTLVVLRTAPQEGGMPLPAGAEVVGLRPPLGTDARRKLSVLLHLPYYVAAIGREVRAADAVHTPLPGDIPLLGMALALLWRRPLVARYGGSWVPTRHTTLMNRLTRQWMRWAAGGSNVMLATGLDSQRPAPGMEWVFTTAISEAEIRAIRPDLDRPTGRPLHLVYAGRLSSEKGVADLLDAMPQLGRPDGAPLARLTIIGDGPERPSLERRVDELGLRPTVRFVGQMRRAELLSMLLDADLCVLPSRSESFCKARLDALLCGVPVLTTEVGFGRQIVGNDGERGWIVPSGNPGALAAGLLRALARTGEWPSLRRRGRAFAEGYTLERWAAEIYGQCATRWPHLNGTRNLPT